MGESDIQKPDSAAGSGAAAASQNPRRGSFSSFWEAVKHVHTASVSDGVRQRHSDYVTIGLVLFCIISLFAAIALPVAPALKLLPLVFTVGAVVFYIINRLGIILSLTQRQALIVWQILIAAFWLGVTSSMLIVMLCAWFFSSSAQ